MLILVELPVPFLRSNSSDESSRAGTCSGFEVLTGFISVLIVDVNTGPGTKGMWIFSKTPNDSEGVFIYAFFSEDSNAGILLET